MIDDFIERKWGRRAVRRYLLPELEPLLRETLGVIVYQEQVMQISATSSHGLTRSAKRTCCVARWAKKTRKRWPSSANTSWPELRPTNIPSRLLGPSSILMKTVAGYGFNKSHSAAYALLAYHTAWLKTHYPVEFMAALLTSETSKPENVVKYISECREMSIPVVPPNVQMSDANFTPVEAESGEAIGFGLAAIKNVGHNAIVSFWMRGMPVAARKGSPDSRACGSSATRSICGC